ncbi:MAG: hypothetical protein NC413_03260 [Muribaculum sp.]|nr:hypothetical protein [Muribaculum sp.]
MMNKYIAIEMSPTRVRIGGSFMTTASFKLDNIQAPFSNVLVKIDTGCSISTIPLARFQALKGFCDSLKAADIEGNVHYEISYGVETGGEKHKRPDTDAEKMSCSAMKFQHTICNFQIAGMSVKNDVIYVNYNRKGNILIGMDILQYWDIHMGTSRITGKKLLLACPEDSICLEYRNALEENFGIR